MTTVLHDRFDRDVRLTDERIAHILEHAEMVGQLDRVEKTVREPDIVVRSQCDPNVHLYHKHYSTTPVTEKDLLVAIKVTQTDAFVLTAFFTDTIKKENGYGKNESMVRQGGRFSRGHFPRRQRLHA